MAANLPNIPASKVSASTSTSFTANPSISSPSLTSEPQRRGGGSGGFGSGAATRVPLAAPRNKQANRNQHGGKYSRKYKFTDEDALAESAVMNSTNSRKGQTSITHLMNFSLPPRPARPQQAQHNRYARRNPTWGLGSGYHAVDKARYVHANYRFIVDPRQEYHAQSVDADIYLDWNHVLQILASPQSQATACPICLGEPTAPRMAKCGHVFCIHCLIRYMHSADESEQQHLDKRARWRKCPICWDSIYISETRPVRWYLGQEAPAPREGADIVLRLVMRPAGSTLALPKDADAIARTEDIPWHFAADVMDYARVMKATKDYMLAQYDSEVEQLEQLERYDELMFGEGSEWTQKGIRSVQNAKKTLLETVFAPKKSAEPSEMLTNNLPEKSTRDVSNTIPIPTVPPGTSKANTSTLSMTLASLRAQQGRSSAATPSDYHFYQALLHYYLAPLDIRILKAAFSDFSAFPSTVLPRVEHVSHGHVVDEDLRKRAKYLAHLPFGCEVGFLECDWTDIVPSDILAQFKSDIERRRKRNLEKEAQEEKDRLRAEKEEDDKRWAAARQKRSSSPHQQFRPDDFQPLGASDIASVAGSAGTTGAESTSPLWTSQRQQNGSAFATLASPSTSPQTTRTVWGTMAIQPSSPLLPPVEHEESLAADDGWLQGWEKDLLHHETDLVAQLDATTLDGGPSRVSTGPGKKKKGKKITLMSTNVRRGA